VIRSGGWTLIGPLQKGRPLADAFVHLAVTFGVEMEAVSILVLTLGYSHEIHYALPKGISAAFEKPNLIILVGDDKVLVGQVAAEIISFRKPEPYKGKGVKVFGKAILRKEGKKK
jgi:ribosomal protein L6P/L9E